MSRITAILHVYGQVTDLSENVIVKRINITLFDLLARCHYILKPPRMQVFMILAIIGTEKYILVFSWT